MINRQDSKATECGQRLSGGHWMEELWKLPEGHAETGFGAQTLGAQAEEALWLFTYPFLGSCPHPCRGLCHGQSLSLLFSSPPHPTSVTLALYFSTLSHSKDPTVSMMTCP